jgi:hypothetical protein
LLFKSYQAAGQQQQAIAQQASHIPASAPVAMETVATSNMYATTIAATAVVDTIAPPVSYAAPQSATTGVETIAQPVSYAAPQPATAVETIAAPVSYVAPHPAVETIAAPVSFARSHSAATLETIAPPFNYAAPQPATAYVAPQPAITVVETVAQATPVSQQPEVIPSPFCSGTRLEYLARSNGVWYPGYVHSTSATGYTVHLDCGEVKEVAALDAPSRLRLA